MELVCEIRDFGCPVIESSTRRASLSEGVLWIHQQSATELERNDHLKRDDLHFSGKNQCIGCSETIYLNHEAIIPQKHN
jgi:hypothetical protein